MPDASGKQKSGSVSGNWAKDVGFDYVHGHRASSLVGSGSYLPVFLHRLALEIGMHRLEARVGFCEHLGLPFHVPGRLDVFSQFNVCFREREQAVVFEA